MIDYKKMREKFPSKRSDKRERVAKINAIAREYERKKAALGARAPTMRRGFPYYMVILIGLMLVGALVIPQIMNNSPAAVDKAKRRLENVEKDLHTLAVALGRYRYHTGTYPTTEQGLEQLAVRKLSRKDPVSGWNGPYISQLKPDPWQNPYVYAYDGKAAEPTLFSKGPDGEAGTADDIAVRPEGFDEPFRDTSWTNGWMPQHLRGYVVAQNDRHKESLEAQVEAVLHPEVLGLGRTVLADGWEFAQAWKDTLPETGVPHEDPGVDSPKLGWKSVRLPHDWAVSGPFVAACPDGKTGKLPWRGVGYYRRTLVVSEKAKGKYVALHFNGVMSRPEVFLNGEKVGGTDYGYLGFEVDVSDKIRFGEDNTLVVRADTSSHASRWYPGAGIVRDVIMVIEDAEDRMIDGSLAITTLSATEGDDGLAKMRAVYRTPSQTVTNDFEVVRPIFWSPEHPFLYRVNLAGRTCTYGIRTVAFTADDGLHLNGRRLQVKGVNLHSDYGPLGAIFDREAARRVLTTMKDMGANAIRTSHNPVDPGFLDLCDEMGFLVWNECFDKWDGTAGIRSGEDQDEVVTRNLRTFVRRDRNHPSVVCWSIGNEIPHRSEKYPSGTDAARCAKYRAAVLEEDATRPVGIGCCHQDCIAAGDFEALDLTGWNYNRQYAKMKERYPEKPVVYSESASAFSSFGYYALPMTARPLDYGDTTVEIDSHDRCSASWSDIPDAEFARMETDRYCAGEFVWTGLDYLGEPTPNNRLNRSSFFGICDLTGLPKDRFYLYRSLWNEKDKTIHLLPHWNWEGHEGETVVVTCLTSGDEAELFVNGVSAGRRAKLKDVPPVVGKSHPDYYRVTGRYRLSWEVPYEAGELRVVVYKDGAWYGEDRVETAGKPAAVRLTSSSTHLATGEIAYATVELEDENKVTVPKARDTVSFALEGPGEIVAVGNGSTSEMKSFAETDSHPLYNGRAVVIVRRTEGSGLPVRLTATVGGLQSATIDFKKR